jgi:hypothetical protein
VPFIPFFVPLVSLEYPDAEVDELSCSEPNKAGSLLLVRMEDLPETLSRSTDQIVRLGVDVPVGTVRFQFVSPVLSMECSSNVWAEVAVEISLMKHQD